VRVVLLPLKRPDGAKQRLARFLNSEQRQHLFWAMLDDVAIAIEGATLPDKIVVVTSSKQVLRYARARKWDVFLESEQRSESASVDEASLELSRQGVNSVLRIPGDVPLLCASDVDEILIRSGSSRSCVLVPSHDGKGTNAVLRTPPEVFPSRFGRNSLKLHRTEAESRGVSVEIHKNDRLALDVDTPRDIELLLNASGGNNSREVLKGIFSANAGEGVLSNF
jgi:2-phospho-L-lactate guanylyltransferase